MKRWLSLFAALGLAAAVAGAQNRQISGTVVEDGSNAPIGSAQVQVRGTTFGALSREDGTFTVQAPARDVVLIVRRIGYPPVEQSVAAGTTTTRIVMRRDPLKLEQVVITGQASGISRTQPSQLDRERQ